LELSPIETGDLCPPCSVEGAEYLIWDLASAYICLPLSPQWKLRQSWIRWLSVETGMPPYSVTGDPVQHTSVYICIIDDVH